MKKGKTKGQRGDGPNKGAPQVRPLPEDGDPAVLKPARWLGRCEECGVPFGVGGAGTQRDGDNPNMCRNCNDP